MRRIWIHGAALLLGLGLGIALVRTAEPRVVHVTGSNGLNEAGKEPARKPEAVGVRISRMISAESPAMDEALPVNKALDVLFAERKSPMRTRAFLKSRIQMMTTEQLAQSLINGDVQSPAELAEVARRLAKEDPEGAFNHLEAMDFRFSGMENLYTFVDALLQTWGDADGVAVMERLKKMKRGGSQQDFSLRFSSYWSKVDPAAAADHFEDLIYLRNMQDQGNMVFTDNTYAEEIVRSWAGKDEKAMLDYIEVLPAGRKKDALEKAVTKVRESNR